MRMDSKDTARFWAKVDVRGACNCWEWTACKNRDGYGKFRIKGNTRFAHRIAYIIMRGEIPEHLHLSHICKNSGCVNPLHLKTSDGDAAKRYYEHVVLSNTSDECLIWPFARDSSGYGVFGQRRGAIRSSLVSRVACADTQGLPPTTKHQAAHNCGNGHLGCVNPNHLSWKTAKENCADKELHGTTMRGERYPLAKLDSERVREIISMKGKISRRQIARQFGVSASTVGEILRGERWKHITYEVDKNG